MSLVGHDSYGRSEAACRHVEVQTPGLLSVIRLSGLIIAVRILVLGVKAYVELGMDSLAHCDLVNSVDLLHILEVVTVYTVLHHLWELIS